MKKIIFYSIISMSLGIMSCEEDDNRGQFPIDSTPTGIVTDIKVQNEKGYSVLTYTKPTDEDLLYVEAEYINSLGNEVVVRASAFTNTMKLNGFLNSKKVPVKVYAIDKSFNYSEVTKVEIEPLDNPMFDILESMTYNAIFGGIGLSWQNATEEDIIVEFLTFNSESATYENFKSIYSTASDIDVKIRGLEAISSEYGAVIRDEFGQRTDTLKFNATPLFEEQIESDNFRELPHNPDFNAVSYNDGFGVLWNGSTGKESYSIFGSGIDKVYFTMNLGEEIKLSRFKMWSRNDFIYGHSHPRRIVLLGTNDQAIANNPTSEDGWETIGEWYDEKPSGNSAEIAPTEEDIAYFNAGMDFEVDINASSYQYLRFVTLESWGKTDRMWLAELRFWGQRIN
ncbi:DUF4959 domain-containing protein [Maribacter ulvicola]|uniref:DUF4959 domain-containing protein n=1 Tax=Maribacter ulvicola TaxID=228959 RepID=A0A1N6ZXP4_9FLAO|nr:DUF5000 domain-containing lipoprotein [Maribacter ulvicola]SIR31642.1 protein of unknown function [Maribacter ulvicola]